MIPVFCYTHKVKMGTFSQLILVFASSWYFLKRKRFLLCSVLKFKISLIFVCNVVFIVASFKGGRMDSHCIYFGRHKHLNHFHLLGTGPASVKILFLTKLHLFTARRSCPYGEKIRLSWETVIMERKTSFVSHWGTCLSVPWGQAANLSFSGNQNRAWPWRTWRTSAVGLFHHTSAWAVFQDTPGRHPPPCLPLFPSSVSLACDIPSKMSISRMPSRWLEEPLLP